MIFLKRIALFLLALILFGTTACGLPVENLVQQPESPLIPGPNTIPAGAWQLLAVEYQDQQIEFDAVAPVVFHFGDGRLSVQFSEASGCFGFGAQILSNDGKVYVLKGEAAPPLECGEPMDTQKAALATALHATNTYEVQGERLVLIGHDARLTLRRGAPPGWEAKAQASLRPLESPLVPDEEPILLENQWRLTEMVHNEERHTLDRIQPVLVTFQPGTFTIRACNRIVIFTDTTDLDAPNAYRFTARGGSTTRECPNGGSEQESDFMDALYDTDHYEIQGDRLILFGDHARLTFVIDNEAEKPADWM